MRRVLALLACAYAACAHAASAQGRAQRGEPRRVENELAELDVLSFATALSAADANVTALPAVVAEGALVTVSYIVRAPAAGDFVALYLNAPNLTGATLPLKWAFIDDAAYLATGAGARSFQLANFRALSGFAFGVLTGSTRDRYGSLSVANATLRALSAPVRLAGDVLAPQRPRLTPGARDGSTLRVTWTSGRDAAAAPALAWGLAAGGPYPFFGARVSTARLTPASLCGPPANGTGFSDLGFTHTAEIVLADAGAARPARIFYVLSDAVSGAGNETRAAVPRAAGAGGYPASLIAFDDFGRGSLDDAKTFGEYGSPSINTSRSIAARLDADADAYLAVWLVGDLSYATGLLPIWDWWTFMISSWAGRVAFAVGLGNR